MLHGWLPPTIGGSKPGEGIGWLGRWSARCGKAIIQLLTRAGEANPNSSQLQEQTPRDSKLQKQAGETQGHLLRRGTLFTQKGTIHDKLMFPWFLSMKGSMY